MTGELASERHQPQRFYEALGRTMAALRASGALEGARALHWWHADQTWKIEWREGPYPYEAAARLWQAAASDESLAALALGGMIRLDPPTGGPGTAFLRVLDVPVMLRALDPIGFEEVARRSVESLEQMMASLDRP